MGNTSRVVDRMRLYRYHVRLHSVVVIDGRRHAATIVDIHRQGAFVQLALDELNPPPRVGESVMLNFRVPEGDEFRIEAVIRWLALDENDEHLHGFGVEFMGAAAERARLEQLLLRVKPLVVVYDPTDPAHIGRPIEQDFNVSTCLNIEDVYSLCDGTLVAVVIIGPAVDNALAEELLVMLERKQIAHVRLHDVPSIEHAQLKTTIATLVVKQELASENARLRLELTRVNRRLQRQKAVLSERAVTSQTHGLLGDSALIAEVRRKIDRLGPTLAPIHIHGETGVGKELAARAVHERSQRRGRFVAQNCGGIPETLLHAVFFGHEKGAYTGATQQRPGVFQLASGGTLFLDEVAELSAGTQSALLRVLQEGEVVPIGASFPVKVDVRILSATHVDLRERVGRGEFREDLYYRLVVAEMHMPPLRDRREDISLLANAFVDQLTAYYKRPRVKLTAEALEKLEQHRWPGNVRELRNCLERAVILLDASDELIPAEWLDLVVADSPAHAATVAARSGGSYDEQLEHWQRAVVSQALDQHHGNVSRTAEALHIERSRLGKMLRRWRLR